MDDQRYRHGVYTNLEQDVSQMKDDIRVIKHDLKHLIDQKNVGKSDRSDKVLQYLQQFPSTSARHTGTPDMLSDTASTTSTGSEDDYGFRTKCLSDSVQRHFLRLMRNVPFGAIADIVLEKHVVTVKESERIRSLALDDDKMRSLLRNVMDKDYNTIMKFLNTIGECDPVLKESILSTFNDRCGVEPHRMMRCTVCLIKSRTNIKDLCDHFFTRSLISRELHTDITDSPSRKGNEVLWQRLLEELSKERPEYILNVVKEILNDGEGEIVYHHTDILKRIDGDLTNHRSFKCRCNSSKKRPFSPLSPGGRCRPKSATDAIYTTKRPRSTGSSSEFSLGKSLKNILLPPEATFTKSPITIQNDLHLSETYGHSSNSQRLHSQTLFQRSNNGSVAASEAPKSISPIISISSDDSNESDNEDDTETNIWSANLNFLKDWKYL